MRKPLVCANGGCIRTAQGRSNFCQPCWDLMMRQELEHTHPNYRRADFIMIGCGFGLMVGLVLGVIFSA